VLLESLWKGCDEYRLGGVDRNTKSEHQVPLEHEQRGRGKTTRNRRLPTLTRCCALPDGSIHRPGLGRPHFSLERTDELVDLLCALFDALRLADFAIAPQAASFFEQLFAVLRSAQMHVGQSLAFGSHECSPLGEPAGYRLSHPAYAGAHTLVTRERILSVHVRKRASL